MYSAKGAKKSAAYSATQETQSTLIFVFIAVLRNNFSKKHEKTLKLNKLNVLLSLYFKNQFSKNIVKIL